MSTESTYMSSQSTETQIIPTYSHIIGEKISEWLKLKNLRQKELSDNTGIDTVTINRVVNGGRIYGVEIYEKISSALKLSNDQKNELMGLVNGASSQKEKEHTQKILARRQAKQIPIPIAAGEPFTEQALKMFLNVMASDKRALLDAIEQDIIAIKADQFPNEILNELNDHQAQKIIKARIQTGQLLAIKRLTGHVDESSKKQYLEAAYGQAHIASKTNNRFQREAIITSELKIIENIVASNFMLWAMEQSYQTKVSQVQDSTSAIIK